MNIHTERELSKERDRDRDGERFKLKTKTNRKVLYRNRKTESQKASNE